MPSICQESREYSQRAGAAAKMVHFLAPIKGIQRRDTKKMWSGPKLLEREREGPANNPLLMKGITGDEQHSKADKKPVQLGKSGCCLHLCILDHPVQRTLQKYVGEKNRAL